MLRTILVVAILALASCASSSRPAPARAIGEAFGGPANLTLRKELAPRSPAVGTVKHGERLEVLETRRRFTRVRTAQGVEGWTDGNLLLTPAEMDGLKQLAARASKMPSQGRATVFDALNVHTEPSRQAPSFHQIKEGGSVEVLAHRLAPRSAPVQASPKVATPKKASRKKKPADKALKGGVPAPPAPAPPKLPPNWLELSRPRASELAAPAPAPPPVAPPAPQPVDDWNLVRTPEGAAGWVLARMLVMGIPDEIAQYAEGHRITAYLPLGEVNDRKANTTRTNYLWTTITRGQEPYQFDSFRVFVWSIQRHRYETAYIERNVRGYYPIEFVPGLETPAFRLVVENKQGELVRKTFAFSGYRVRMVKQEPYQKPPDESLRAAAPATAPASQPAPGFGERIRAWWKRARGR